MSKKKKEQEKCLVCSGPAWNDRGYCSATCEHQDLILETARSARAYAMTAEGNANEARREAIETRYAAPDNSTALSVIAFALFGIFVLLVFTNVHFAGLSSVVDDIKQTIAPYTVEAPEDTP